MRSVLVALALSSLFTPALAEGGYRFKYIAIMSDDQGQETAWQFISGDTFPNLDACKQSLKWANDSFKLGTEKRYPDEHLKVVKSFASCYPQDQKLNSPLFPIKE